MPPLFWLDVAVLTLAGIVTASLTLIALGFAPRQELNRIFGLFTLSLFVWAFFSVCVRLSLGIEKGNPLLLTEASIPPLAAAGIFLLMFTTRYLNRSKTWIDRAAFIGLLLVAVVAIPLFQDRLINKVYLDANGTMLADISPWGALAALIPSFYLCWSLLLFWQHRREVVEPYMSASALLILAGIILGGIVMVRFPISSLCNAASVTLLAYGTFSRQFFNPLRNRTLELQEQIAERIKAEEALRTSEVRLRSLLTAIPDVILTFGPDGQVYEVFSTSEGLIRAARDEIVGRKISAVLPPSATGMIMDVIQKALVSRQVQEYEYSMPGTGSKNWFQARAVAYDIQGEQRVLWLSRNITTLKQALDQQAKANIELVEAYEATLEGWSRALELREHETAGHSQRVIEVTLQLAQIFQFPRDQLVHIRRGALLHDIGKLGIPDSILLKPGPLTTEEWGVMHQHPVYSRQFLESIPYLHPALTIPFYHHEHWDGSGYPNGLKGEEIPLEARIFAVVDEWDALTSKRPYRPAYSLEEARQILSENAGISLDPHVVEAFFQANLASPA